MTTSLTSSHPTERWEVGDPLWSRDPTTGAFELVDYRGFGAPPPACDPLDLATLVGARVSTEGAEEVCPSGEGRLAESSLGDNAWGIVASPQAYELKTVSTRSEPWRIRPT